MEPRRTQAARSETAREQIAQAALTVFALKGYAASSMDDVCLAAGCSKGGLYHHFRSKSAVLSGVVERLAARGALMPPFPPETQLAPEALGRVLIEIWAEAARDATLRGQLRQCYETLFDAALPADGSLGLVLRIGTLVQLLTLNELDSDAVARRLGVERAA